MRILDFIQSKMLAVWHIPHSTPTQRNPLGGLTTDFLPLERILLLILFLILFYPPLKERDDPQLEKERKTILRLSAIAGALTLLMRFMRSRFAQ